MPDLAHDVGRVEMVDARRVEGVVALATGTVTGAAFALELLVTSRCITRRRDLRACHGQLCDIRDDSRDGLLVAEGRGERSHELSAGVLRVAAANAVPEKPELAREVRGRLPRERRCGQRRITLGL